MYFVLGGILDGRAGFTWCMLQAFYEYLITLKVWELQNGCTSDVSVLADSSAVDQPTKELARST